MSWYVRHLTDPLEAAAALADVALDAALDSVLLTVLDRCVSDPAAYADRHWWIVEADAEIVGVAFRTAPFPLGLGLEPGPWLVPLVDAVRRDAPTVTNVASLRPRAEAFAEVWLGRPAGADREVMASRILRCAALVPPVDVPGNARPVDAGELATLYDWEDAFHDELGLTHHSPDDARPDPTGRAFWWVDGDSPVSLAIHTPPVQGVARVGPVYTPPESRRRGYAAAVTAAATRAAYDTGAREVVLYTDAANPTSNGVYERIGYVHVADAVELRLTDVSGLSGPSG